MAWGMRNIVIGLFGSSIIEGRIGAEDAGDRYYALLQKKLSQRFPEVCFSIINGAVGGWSTRELMGVFDKEIGRIPLDYCIVMHGANNHDQDNPERILKEGELQQLMDEFDSRLPDSCRRIGVICNPVINRFHSVTSNPAWQNLLQQYGGLDEVMETEREEARAYFAGIGCPVVDLGKVMRSDPEKYILTSDGIHLSPAGHRLFADLLFEVLEKEIISNGQDTNGR